MLSSRTFLYSGVSGASCPNPHGLVWSKDGWPGSPRTTNRSHWPFQSGYLASSAPALASGIASATSAKAAINFSHGIIPSWFRPPPRGTKCANHWCLLDLRQPGLRRQHEREIRLHVGIEGEVEAREGAQQILVIERERCAAADEELRRRHDF